MRKLIPMLILLCIPFPLACWAEPVPPVQHMEVSSIKPLLLAAIENGTAHGVLNGKVHDTMRKVFKTDAPIIVDVERVAAHRQPGCARLSVMTKQAAVVLPAKTGAKSAPSQDMRMRYQVDFCSTGEFPAGEQ